MATRDPYIGQVTVAPAGDDKYAYGTRVKITQLEFVPLSASQFWSAFDSYLPLQAALGGHGETRLETGPGKPAEGPGATIVFFGEAGGVTREVLLTKDDVNRIWSIGVPGGNTMFTSYTGTASIVSESADGCIGSYAFEVVLASPDPLTRKGILDQTGAFATGRVVEAARFVLHRDGIKVEYTLPIHTPIRELWRAVGDWGNVSWVNGATRAELVTPTIRRIINADGSSTEERKVSANDETHTLVYEIYGGAMPVRMYQGTVRLDQTGEDTTQLTYNQQFIPRDGLDPNVVRAQISAAFLQRMAWVQKKFDTRKPA